MKTVWHWKNIGKAWIVVLLAAILFAGISTVIGIPEEVSSLIGVGVGFFAMIFSVCKWELWHFE